MSVAERSPVVAIGASAGGVEALINVVAHLPADLPHAILVSLHMPPGGRSELARILNRSGPLPAISAEHGQALIPGTIFTARPDHHLLLDEGRVLLTDGPTENRHRPSINALFRSVALHAGTRATGVLLSGVGDDGVDGLLAIAARGGVTAAQHPDDAVYPTLPSHAIAALRIDHVVPAAAVGDVLAAERSRPRQVDPDALYDDTRLELENRIAMGSRYDHRPSTTELGSHSGYVCPDCGGSLIEMSHNHNYRCRIGHAWTGQALLDAQDGELDTALSMALRTLHERISLAEALAASATSKPLRERYQHTAHQARTAADELGARLVEAPPPPED